ncbi:cob(I)yrinic acid a,c-diamide adenosyltransferase [Candidatus Thiothrix sp. Deng01]|uniref:Corrinoid adenosyltransferase n=1 Tax=Candidatus Thiothrix phosphatis TaxID=3112415 RepID=A0ABU6D315_9GAMM|nr:cob(I)yrinic acid a,c-diamide adenosyltransferase [Candidatus Thiothrix sp. Deng01]MEB4593484.1 cob(I)yrinic acid a,c-diamide adenosyltransferase [Candidatus Thiothrix sp. Deng01]
MTGSDQHQRHQTRMQRKKAVIDASIARANQDKGLLVVLTGNGKGKSSSAFGMVGRALGHGMQVGVCQFLKSRTDTGEEAFFGRQPGCEWHVLGDGFTWETQSREQDIATAQHGWEVARQMLADPNYALVVLDELTYLLNYGYLDAEEVLKAIAARPPLQHVVVTGRAASPALCGLADTVAEIADVKHAFRSGIQAQKGIDL